MSTPSSLRDSAVFNFSEAVTMIVDDSPFSLTLTANALAGFGIRPTYAVGTGTQAQKLLKDKTIDLLVVDTDMPDIDGYELVRWLRRSAPNPNAFVPVIMTASHIRRGRVTEARDCGANFVVTKPFSPSLLLERILWVARDNRPFLEVGDYFGPDRRIRNEEYDGEERRADMLRRRQNSENAL
ncbi:response regulator [Brevundimonas sp. SORGH_AS_0993]|uniref:response regulator n=1 Tax=Brevundimonas sp. SORGH_AS_0993 TaxID=3041794 RepID=UPI00277E896F|nr:response regulator [Brevundimonas sp. SORGH_AS_0993]MDQ1153861.1 CheY-like chemotaxis protein [Brevundimonas sp. SORGH_AS_0993]